MRRSCSLALASIAAVLTSTMPGLAGEAEGQRVRVLVRPAGGDSDFSAPGVTDSVKDLRGKLDGKKSLQLVDSAEQADVIVEVLGRGKEYLGHTKTQVTEMPTYDASGQLTTAKGAKTSPVKSAVLVTRLVVGEYSTEIMGESQRAIGGWGQAAGSVAKQVEDWVKENQAKLLQRRKPK